MRAEVFRECVKEYPGLECDPYRITLGFGIVIARLDRSSRGNVTAIHVPGGSIILNPTEDDVRTVIESGLRSQIERPKQIVVALEKILRSGDAVKR